MCWVQIIEFMAEKDYNVNFTWKCMYMIGDVTGNRRIYKVRIDHKSPNLYKYLNYQQSCEFVGLTIFMRVFYKIFEKVTVEIWKNYLNYLN